MSLRGQIRALRWSMVAAFVVLAVGADGHIPRLVAVVAMCALPLLAALAPVFAVQRAHRCLRAAGERGDSVAYRRISDELLAFYGDHPSTRVHMKLIEASALSFEERWADARTVLDSIAPEGLPRRMLVHVENTLAWVLAHLGESDRAVELARSALGRAEADVPRTIGFCNGTLGTALVLAGRLAQGLPHLERALTRPEDGAEAQCIRNYYLAEALRGLHRLDEARSAFEQAVALTPQSRFGRRAKARLEEVWTPYR
jgi:tetratricopeptide (TPR) repeat protein